MFFPLGPVRGLSLCLLLDKRAPAPQRRGDDFRKSGRVVEGTGLENRQAGDRLVGSNPTSSAIALTKHMIPLVVILLV